MCWPNSNWLLGTYIGWQGPILNPIMSLISFISSTEKPNSHFIHGITMDHWIVLASKGNSCSLSSSSFDKTYYSLRPNLLGPHWETNYSREDNNYIVLLLTFQFCLLMWYFLKSQLIENKKKKNMLWYFFGNFLKLTIFQRHP